MAERTAELRRDIEQTREHMTGTLEAIGDRVSPARVAERRWARVRQSTGRLSERVMGAPREAAASAKDRAGEAADSLGETASSVGDAISGTPDRIETATQGNPVVAGAVAFGLGLLVGSLTPPSREETKLAEQVMEPLQQQATALAHDVAEPVKQQALEGMEQTKQAATDAADDVEEHARGAAQAVSAQARSAKDEVTDEARTAADEVRSRQVSSG